MGNFVTEILEGHGQEEDPPMTALAEPVAWCNISRQVRANMGLGRDKFARLLQVSPRTVMRWENCESEEPIIPQSIQRMKLLALYLNSDEIENQQSILADLLRQASEMRCGYERRATNIKEYDISLSSELPAWMEDLCRLREEQNWRAISLMGPHFLSRETPVGDQARIEGVLALWLGNSFFMLGEPNKALGFYEHALQLEGLPPVLRCILHSNKGYALIRMSQFEQAESALRESLRIDPQHRGALRNRIALYSLAEDNAAAYEAARDLLSRYPEAQDPESELGRLLLSDPDLRNFRSTDEFGRAFPALAERSLAA